MTLPRDAFYVGYLKLPPALRRPVFAIIALLVAADALLAVLVVWAEPAHPSGAWDQGGEIWFEGRFRARPYPLIEAVTAEGPRIVLLVQEGKHGAPEGLQGLDGQFVSASGYAIRRGDLIVLQLDRMPERKDGPVPPAPPPAAPVRATLAGEIVDAKCWAGAMNPGEGKAHKGCGSLCLLGGIPALFIAEAPDGNGYWYLMAGRDGGPVGDETRGLMDEHVQLSGMVQRMPGLAVFTPDDGLGGGR